MSDVVWRKERQPQIQRWVYGHEPDQFISDSWHEPSALPVSTKAMKGFGTDETFDHTLFRSDIDVMKISDCIQEIVRQKRRRNNSKIGPLFNNRARDGLFGGS